MSYDMPSKVFPTMSAAGVTKASISPCVDSEIFKKIMLPFVMI